MKKSMTILLITLTLTLSLFTLAAGADPVDTTFSINKYLTLDGTKGFGNEPGQINNIGFYLVRTINFMALTIGSFAFLAIVIGGFILVTSGGQEAQLQRGKDIIKFAIIGLIVALLSYFIVSFIQSLVYEYGT